MVIFIWCAIWVSQVYQNAFKFQYGTIYILATALSATTLRISLNSSMVLFICHISCLMLQTHRPLNSSMVLFIFSFSRHKLIQYNL